MNKLFVFFEELDLPQKLLNMYIDIYTISFLIFHLSD